MAFNIKIPFSIATHVKKFSSTSALVNKTKAGALGFVSDVLYQKSGASAIALVSASAAQTLTGKTLTGNINADTKFCTTQLDATSSAALANVVGMVQTVVVGTYLFVVRLPGTATVNGGVKAAFKYTTTVLTSLEATGQASTASATATQHTTTATDQASLIASTTATIYTEISGQMVVSTGGTVQFQFAQNASHIDTSSVYVGASMTFTRVA